MLRGPCLFVVLPAFGRKAASLTAVPTSIYYMYMQVRVLQYVYLARMHMHVCTVGPYM